MEDFAPAIAADSRHVIPWRVIDATALADYRLAVKFVDGINGTVHMKALIHSPRAGVFAQLTNETLFNQVFVAGGAVTWPGELDLAPDVMYTEIKNKGEWILA